MTTSASRRTVKKQKRTAKSQFDINQLKVTVKKIKGFDCCSYVAAVTYKGKRLKKYTSACRSIYKYENVIIKIELDETEQTQHEINFYKKLARKKVKYDLRYFPKLIAYDLDRGIVVQEFIPLKKGSRTLKQRAIIDKIINKYKIDSDVDAEEDFNWGIDSRNDRPVIYDLGFA